jgi:hypothetical protein
MEHKAVKIVAKTEFQEMSDELKEILEPIYHHIAGDYNKWKNETKEGKAAMSYVEAGNSLKKLMRKPEVKASLIEESFTVKEVASVPSLPDHTFGVGLVETPIYPYIPDEES